MQRRKYCYYNSHCSLHLAADIAHCINDYITSDDVLETEDAQTEYGLPKIWVKLTHATRLIPSSVRAFGEPGNEAMGKQILSSSHYSIAETEDIFLCPECAVYFYHHHHR